MQEINKETRSSEGGGATLTERVLNVLLMRHLPQCWKSPSHPRTLIYTRMCALPQRAPLVLRGPSNNCSHFQCLQFNSSLIMWPQEIKKGKTWAGRCKCVPASVCVCVFYISKTSILGHNKDKTRTVCRPFLSLDSSPCRGAVVYTAAMGKWLWERHSWNEHLSRSRSACKPSTDSNFSCFCFTSCC